MSADWPVVRLSDCASFQEGYVNPSQRNSEYFDGSVKWLRAVDLNDAFVENTTRSLTELGFKSAGKSALLFEPETLAISKSGTIGRLGILKDYMCGNRAVINIKIDNSKCSTLFIFFVLLSNRKTIESLSVGSVQKNLYTSALGSFEFRLPPLETQCKIADTLGSVNNKIHLNTQTNQTLESIAQAIFKSWFVDFEPVKAKMAAKERWYAMQPTSESASPVCYADEAAMPDLETYTNLAAMCAISGKSESELAQLQQQNPDHYQQLAETAALFPSAMVGSELGEIPEGWEVKSVSDFGNIVCGKTPSKSEARYFGPGIPFIKIPDMHNEIYVVNPIEELSLLGADSQKKKTIPAGSICVSCIATVGKVVLTHRPSQTNQQINSIVPTSPEFTFYLYFQMKSKEQEFHDLASGGSATLNMNTSTFSKINVLLPTLNSIKAFDSCVKSIFNRVLTTQIESKELAELRDALLPKLLSGEIEVMEIK